nr:gamma-glutamyltransferase [Actinomycetota bacterium]
MPTAAPFTTRHAPTAMVCSVDHLASEAGVAMLRAGGNAVDAAIAANAVLTVTAQHMCGLGGDLWALVHRPGDDAPAVLNASGRAGSGADPDRLRAEGHTAMPATMDIRAVPVPGCVDGWAALHERFGRLPMADLLAPARGYAVDGFPPSPMLRNAIAAIAHLPEAADFTAGGTLLRRPGVARALAAIAERG